MNSESSLENERKVLERKILTEAVTKAVKTLIFELARDTVSAVIEDKNCQSQFPGPMSPTFLLNILTHLLPGGFPNSQGEPFNLNNPNAKFPPLFVPNRKEKEEGYTSIEILAQATALAVSAMKELAVSSGYKPKTQEGNAVLKNIASGDISTYSQHLYPPTPLRISEILEKIGVGPTNNFLCEKLDAKNRWSQDARAQVQLSFLLEQNTSAPDQTQNNLFTWFPE